MTISAEQKRFVWRRANDCCEYCRLKEVDRLVKLHIDHILAVKHGGTDGTENLCLACYQCNGYKGSNIASVDSETGQLSRLYNPRQQEWTEHFEINEDASLEGLTPEGRVTIFVLRLNDESRLRSRRLSLRLGEYPCEKA